MAERWHRRLAPVAGLSAFGVSHVVLKPGAWSSQRHWHAGEDEFLVMLAGEAVLVGNAGPHPLVAGDCAAFRKGERNGHHLQNRSEADYVFAVVGAGQPLGGNDPDIDMRFTAEGRYVHDDGRAYQSTRA